MIYLICGPSGAGKTTHAREIALEKQAIHLAIDECLKPLSIPSIPDFAYAQTVLDKAKICAGQVLEKAAQLLAQSNHIVLDVATFRRKDRDFIRAWAASLNSSVILYYISASLITRRTRVLNRNMERGNTYSFDVPEWWFAIAEKLFEPPAEDETAIYINND